MKAHPTHSGEIKTLLHGGRTCYDGVISRNTCRRFTDIGPLYEKLKNDGFNPGNACEVGSWVGCSAIRFVAVFDSPIVCVDTWLGSEEHWIERNLPAHEMHVQNGRPRLYEEFLETTYCIRDQVTPLPLPSSIAAKVLSHHKFRFDLIYIDGDHSEKGLTDDIDAFFPLLADGGILIGDDLNDPRFEVKKAVGNRFTEYEVFQNNWWIVRK